MQEREAIRRILLEDWDPCAVGTNPNLREDYDEFIPRLEAALLRDAVSTELAALLEQFENDMCAPVEPAVRLKAAQRLAALRE